MWANITLPSTNEEIKQQFYSIIAALSVFFEAHVTYTQSAVTSTLTAYTHMQLHKHTYIDAKFDIQQAAIKFCIHINNRIYHFDALY